MAAHTSVLSLDVAKGLLDIVIIGFRSRDSAGQVKTKILFSSNHFSDSLEVCEESFSYYKTH